MVLGVPFQADRQVSMNMTVFIWYPYVCLYLAGLVQLSVMSVGVIKYIWGL